MFVGFRLMLDTPLTLVKLRAAVISGFEGGLNLTRFFDTPRRSSRSPSQVMRMSRDIR